MPPSVIKKPNVEISEELRKQLTTKVDEEGQVILHVIYHAPMDEFMALIRIWPTSFLYDKHSEHKSELVHAENISYYPSWHQCIPGVDNYFTLIFTGLPKSCTVFDFIEHCGGGGGAFEVKNIQRNSHDVYNIRL